ncbi:MAG: hypothetical protein M0R80_13215 [Proteobacteria bacterium]|nr:hypothetical protein [Pseudomonadota bacterium]
MGRRGDAKNGINTYIIHSSGSEYYPLVLDNEALAKVAKVGLGSVIGIIGMVEDDCLIVQEIF